MTMMSDTEKVKSVAEILYRMVTATRDFHRSDQRTLKDWFHKQVEGNPDLIAAAGIPEETAKKIQHEIYLIWRWKGNKHPTYENQPEEGWSLEKHIELLCGALAAYGRKQRRSDAGKTAKTQ
jgi:hypothetical protein